MPPGTEEGELVILSGGGRDEREDCVFTLKMGYLEPIDSDNRLAGVKGRLNNLGFFATPKVYGRLSERTKHGLQRFQTVNNLKPTGYINEATRQKLAEAHAQIQ